MIRDTGMYDMGDNANLNIAENHINAGVVYIVGHSASRASHTDPSAKGGENGPCDGSY